MAAGIVTMPMSSMLKTELFKNDAVFISRVKAKLIFRVILSLMFVKCNRVG